MDPADIKTLIESGLIDCQASVSGDGRHFEAVVVSPVFQGKPTITRHRMVYATLGDRFETDVLHALSIKAYTPEQFQAIGNA